jgi:hypothetical protein
VSASEAAVQAAIRVRASELGIRLFRNNVGACVDKTGRMIRYGLANDSAQMQRRFKSSDLIGWLRYEPTLAYHLHSQFVAVFVAIECKREDWHADPARYDDREAAQARWLELVRADGGIAGFCRSVAEFERLVGRE